MIRNSIDIKNKRIKITIKFFTYFLIIIGAIIMIFPLIWMISTSLKPLDDVLRQPPTFFGKTIEWTNYTNLWDPEERNVDIVLLGWNSLKVALIVSIGQVITSSMAGYAFAKLKFRGRDKIFFIYFASIMIPLSALLIPNFIIMRYLDLNGTHTGLVLPFLTSAYATFLMRQYFLSFPKELEDAAKLDGCSLFRFYWNVLLPNSRPILATQFLLTFQWFWNDFQWPLIMLRKPEVQTMQVGLSYLSQVYYTDWGPLMAAAVITIIPIIILFLFTQRFFVESFNLSGIKG